MQATLELLLLLAVAVGLPLYAALARAPRMRRAEAEGREGYRVSAYRKVLFVQWPLAGLAVFLWSNGGRDLADMGLSPPASPGRGLGAAAIVLALLAFLAFQARAVLGDPELRAHVREATRPISFLLPATPQELRWFTAVGATAGVCEEVLFRGFILGLLAGWVGDPLAWAAVTLGFGLGHSYQGLKGVAQTTVLAAVFLGLYLLSGSLLAPIALHAGVDIHSGALISAVAQAETHPRQDPAALRRPYRISLLVLPIVGLALLVHSLLA